MVKRIAAIRFRLHQLLDIQSPHDSATKIFNGVLFGLIIFNALVVVIESTFETLRTYQWLNDLETFSMWIFTLEYISRLWACNEHPRYAGPLLGRIRYACAPLSLVDLFTILPFWLQMAGVNASMLRVLRLFRLMKLGRLMRFSKAYQFIVGAMSSRKDEFLVAIFLMLVTLLLASSFMYFAEHEAQPEIFSSIPATFWWGVITFSSVGYGDAYPVTSVGKVIGGLFAIVGISVFALPAAIFTAALLDQMHAERAQAQAQVARDKK